MKTGGLQSVPHDYRNIEMRYFLTRASNAILKPLYVRSSFLPISHNPITLLTWLETAPYLSNEKKSCCTGPSSDCTQVNVVTSVTILKLTGSVSYLALSGYTQDSCKEPGGKKLAAQFIPATPSAYLKSRLVLIYGKIKRKI
jgi:hypothetical protein